VCFRAAAYCALSRHGTAVDPGRVCERASALAGESQRKIVRTKHVYVWLILLLAVRTWANSGRAVTGQLQTGTIVSVQENHRSSNYVGDTPSDAPLQAEMHSYDVMVRVDCQMYVGRYSSAFDYLPDVLTSGREVEVRVHMHMMVITLPGEQAFRMALAGHPPSTNAGCSMPDSSFEKPNWESTR